MTEQVHKIPVYKRYQVLSVGVDALTMTEALQVVAGWLRDRRSRYIVTANAEMVMRAQHDHGLATALAEADMVLPDGAGIVWAGERLHLPFKERVAGIDFMTALLEWAVQQQQPVYFLGGEPGIAAKAAENLQKRFGDLPLVGVRDGYFDETENDAVLKDIQNSGARLLFAGLGVPKQEYWIRKHGMKLQGITAIGVGGSFDVLAGTLKRAPLWMQKNRLEWLYRLYLQPGRIGRMAVLPHFMWKVYRSR